MDGIRKVSYEELNKSVELVKEVKQKTSVLGVVTRTRKYYTNTKQYDARIGYRGAFNQQFLVIVEGSLDCIANWNATQDGKAVLVWRDKDRVVAHIKYLLAESTEFIDRVRYPMLHHINSNKGLPKDDLAQLLADKLYKTAKVTKKGTATVANTIRAIFEFFCMEDAEGYIKEVRTSLNHKDKAFYIYKTHRFIANHYDALSRATNLSTCMTKGCNEVDNHWVDCDYEKAKEQGFLVGENNNEKTGVFTPNVDGFEGLEDVGLFLLSKYSPEELNCKTEYGFIGRAIGLREGGRWVYVRYYGQERTEEILQQVLKQVSSYRGMTVKAYRSKTTYNPDDGRTRQTFITPYIDGASNFLRLSEEEFTDFIGRPYRLATVIRGHRSDLENDAAGTGHPLGVHTLSQRTWLTEQIPFEARCYLTREPITHHTAELINGYMVHYRWLDKSFIDNLKTVFTTRCGAQDKPMLEDGEGEVYSRESPITEAEIERIFLEHMQEITTRLSRD